jgi:hypothetical protein
MTRPALLLMMSRGSMTRPALLLLMIPSYPAYGLSRLIAQLAVALLCLHLLLQMVLMGVPAKGTALTALAPAAAGEQQRCHEMPCRLQLMMILACQPMQHSSTYSIKYLEVMSLKWWWQQAWKRLLLHYPACAPLASLQ